MLTLKLNFTSKIKNRNIRNSKMGNGSKNNKYFILYIKGSSKLDKMKKRNGIAIKKYQKEIHIKG